MIGINQQINTTSGGNEGVGFAVPIGLVARSLDELRHNGEVKYAVHRGVTTESLYPQLADRLGISDGRGALGGEGDPRRPRRPGRAPRLDQKIRFQGQEVSAGGDVIVAIDGHPDRHESDLPRLISHFNPGDTVHRRDHPRRPDADRRREAGRAAEAGG